MARSWKGRCTDCRRYFPSGHSQRGGLCPACKRLNAILFALHQGGVSCEADRAGQALRIDLYAAVVARGGTIFEETNHA